MHITRTGVDPIPYLEIPFLRCIKYAKVYTNTFDAKHTFDAKKLDKHINKFS